MIFGEPFDTLLKEYKKAHPRAENPLDHLMSLGQDKLTDMLQNAKGRKIEFVESVRVTNADDQPTRAEYA